MNERKQSNVFEDEITIRELILTFQYYFRCVVRQWIILGIIVAVVTGLFLLKTFFTPIEYPAELTFMVSQDDGGAGFNGVSAILGQFGLGGGKSSNNLSKVLKLSQSRKIIQRVLFEKMKYPAHSSKEDFIANHIIKVYDFHERWEEDTTGMVNFLFSQDDLKSFNRNENKALLAVYKKVIGNEHQKGLFRPSLDETTGIMKLSIVTENEQLSVKMANLIYQKLSTFYVTNSIVKHQQTYDLISTKVDSILTELRIKESSLARFKDSHLGLLSRKDKLQEARLTREIQVLSVMYGEVVKNLEIADFTLKSNTPFIEEIDVPIAPLEPIVESKIKAIVFGIIVGFFLGVALIVLSNMYKNIMLEGVKKTDV